LALTCLSSALTRWVKLTLPLMQILVGIFAALPPLHLVVTLDPHLFLFLFIQPLLFADGWRLLQTALKTLRWPVLGHAVGLVFFTVIVGGYALHWLIPVMPLSGAFAVAALVSPTDAVAISGIIERVKVPSRMMHLLESESMLNDASGLVALKFAVAATLGAGFSLLNAGGTFLVIALGGLVIGWVLTFVYYRFQSWKLISSHQFVSYIDEHCVGRTRMFYVGQVNDFIE
jgi:CPA1 family monovalent cation:H+ antiporter